MNTWITQLFAWWLIINLSLIMAYDIVILMTAPEQPTVSRMIYDLGRHQPALYLWVGITIGHIVMPLVISNGKP
jgi:hypothetical protein